MPNKLHLRLRAARERAGYSRERAAKILDINPKTLAGYENAVSKPKPETLKKMSELYLVTIDWLIAGELSKYSEYGSSQIVTGEGETFPVGDMVMIPVVPEGEGLDAHKSTSYFPVDSVVMPHVIQHRDEYIYVRVKTDHMSAAGINPGSMVLIHLGEEPANGEIGMIEVNGESVCRRLYFRPDSITAAPDNPKYPPEVVSASEAKILGRVAMVVSRL